MSNAVAPPPVRTVSTDTLTSCFSKGKKRVDSRVSFAPDTMLEGETSGLISGSRTKYIYGNDPEIQQGDYYEEEEEEEEEQGGSLPSRLHRKLKKGLAFGGGFMRKPGVGLPYYPGSDSQHSETSTVLLYTMCTLLFVAVCVGAGIMANSNEHYPTGPFPRPPRPTPTSSATASWPLPTGFPPPPFPPGLPRNPAYLVKGWNGAVAAENEDCSLMGIDMLKAGGSAVDAAVASTLCTGVTNMFSSGIGGGGFMTVRVPPTSSSANSSVWTVDFRETAPSAANATMFGKNPAKSAIGGLSVGVPGELMGLHEAHRRWGKLPWEKVVMPSAHLARGWRVGKELDKKLKWFGRFAETDPDWAPIFAPHGKLVSEGEWIKRTTYGKTLETVAKKGVSAFYSPSSPIAQSIIKKIEETGGILTFEDLEGYRPRVERAIEGSYKGKKIWTTGPPTSGPALLHILNILENYDLREEGQTPLSVHRLVEALKFGFAARTRLSDPITKKDRDRMTKVYTKEYASTMFAKITDNTTHTAEYYDPVYDVSVDHGTTHISIVDKDGMGVSLTSTVNLVFGSHVLDPETGIILNDELDDFSRPGIPNVFGLYPSPYNYPGANKRPLSSTAPVIIERSDGTLHSVLGGSGGSRIFGAVLQVILNMEWGMDISQAIEEPRVHDQLFPAEMSVESSFSANVMEELRDRGHNVTVFDINLGVAEVQAVAVGRDGFITAASDSRKHGVAASY